MEFEHEAVLAKEVIEHLAIKPQGVYVDCTLGGAGHSKMILEQLNNQGRLIGIDQDSAAIEAAKKELGLAIDNNLAQQIDLVRDNYSNLTQIIDDLTIAKVDGFLFDLGVSSYQLDNPERGFSYRYDAPLDMRMDQRQSKSAATIVNNYSQAKLRKIISDYGEERWAKRIAEFIVEWRDKKELKTTADLVEVIKAAIPASARQDGPHPARRTFQALRIAVNDELGIIKDALYQALNKLKVGGRIAVITFHSLEDRIVKHTFKEMANDCVCPPKFPVCACDEQETVKIITNNPVCASQAELEDNPRARSAKLRVVEAK